MADLGFLLMTHSDRLCERARCSLNFLTRRYASPSRLQELPPIERLLPQKRLHTYGGSLSMFRLVEDGAGRIGVKCVGNLRTHLKMQHAILVAEDSLLIAYEAHLELWRLRRPVWELSRASAKDFSVETRIDHPHLPGLHTAFVLDSDRVVLSASCADALLIANWRTGEIEQTLRMPADLYGQGYELTPDLDLRRHVITNDYQTTHINSAYPLPDGRRIIVSALIPGAVGLFDLYDGSYREIIRGFVGCHGARVTDQGAIYFTDSTTGSLVFVRDDGRILRRFGVDSRWLHDVQQIRGSLYAFTLADANELRIYDIDTETLVYRKAYWTSSPISLLTNHRLRHFTVLAGLVPGWYGNSTQFLSCWLSERPARRTIAPRSATIQKAHAS
jgi:hypothetical protein